MIQGLKATILDAVGGTPIVRLQRVVPAELDVALYARCEFMSPTGSAQDSDGLHCPPGAYAHRSRRSQNGPQGGVAKFP